MNKYRDLLLTACSALLVQLMYMTPVLASLPDRAIPSNQSTHTPPTKPSFFQAENREMEVARSKDTYKLGLKHLTGDGVQKDIEYAVHLFKNAAISGYAEAQLILGLMYQTGTDIPANYEQAQAWLKQAAAQGHADAQLILGIMYSSGWGVNKDYAQALSWLTKAAQQQNPAAEFSLGVMYTKSLGVPQDFDLAKLWFRKAAQHGNTQAKHNLEVIEQRIRDLPGEKIPQTTMNDR